MSYRISTIQNTGKKNVDLNLGGFCGTKDKGGMIQITQGFGGQPTMKPLKECEPGYVELTENDTYKLIIELTKWLQSRAEYKSKKLKEEIKKNKELKKTIFNDAVKCEHFIQDLKMLEIPMRLLNMINEK